MIKNSFHFQRLRPRSKVRIVASHALYNLKFVDLVNDLNIKKGNDIFNKQYKRQKDNSSYMFKSQIFVLPTILHYKEENQ